MKKTNTAMVLSSYFLNMTCNQSLRRTSLQEAKQGGYFQCISTSQADSNEVRMQREPQVSDPLSNLKDSGTLMRSSRSIVLSLTMPSVAVGFFLSV